MLLSAVLSILLFKNSPCLEMCGGMQLASSTKANHEEHHRVKEMLTGHLANYFLFG